MWGTKNTTLFLLDDLSSGHQTILDLSLLLEAYTSQMSIRNHSRGVFTLTLTSLTRNLASIPTTPRVSKLLHHCNSSLSEGCGFLLLKSFLSSTYCFFSCLPDLSSPILYFLFPFFFPSFNIDIPYCHSSIPLSLLKWAHSGILSTTTNCNLASMKMVLKFIYIHNFPQC